MFWDVVSVARLAKRVLLRGLGSDRGRLAWRRRLSNRCGRRSRLGSRGLSRGRLRSYLGRGLGWNLRGSVRGCCRLLARGWASIGWWRRMDSVKNLVVTAAKGEEFALERLDALGGRHGRAGRSSNVRGVEDGLGRCRGIEG